MEAMTKGVALVTGATRGIGKATAVQLAKDGYDIAFCYKQSVEAAEELEGEIIKIGRKVFSQFCNVSDFQSVKNFVQETEEALAPISVLINNAGITRDSPLVLMEEESWKNVINTNLDGVFNFCRCAVYQFIKTKKGCIVNISSVSGVCGLASQVNYSASKAGIIGFSRSLSKELGQYGIRVNAVAPGFIETDMVEALKEKTIEKYVKGIPLGRMGKVDEVASLISFLVSEKASYITGQTIQVDGGIVI